MNKNPLTIRKILNLVLLLGICAGIHHARAAGQNFTELLSQAQAHLGSDQYFLTLDDLQDLQKLAVSAEQKAKVSGLFGQTYYQMRRFDKAEAFLNQALTAGVGENAERGRWLLTLADLQASRARHDDAGRLYAEALKLAGEDRALDAAVRLGQAALLPAPQRLAELAAIRARLDAIPDPNQRARYFLKLGSQAQGLGASGLKLAYESFEQARQNAGERQPRILAESLDGLAQLYEDQNRADESLRLNRQGLNAVGGIDAHDLLINLEWRQGRLLHRQNQDQAALNAYQRAVEHIEAIRHDIPVEYHNGRSSFRETLEPVYLGLADLLLAQARQQSGEQNKHLLQRARDAVELIKQSELEDFLGGRCALQGNKSVLLDSVEPATAVLYPIILPDRLEILVSSGGEIQQFTQPVPAATLKKQTQLFAHSLRNGLDDSKTLGRQLYQWLISPAESWLREHRVKTLVMAPDGVLRLIPPAALFDGEHYLIEEYALAVSPGLSLFAPTPIRNRGVNALLAGMSEPGSVVDHLSAVFPESSAGDSGRGLGKLAGSRALPVMLTANRELKTESGKTETEREVAFRQQLKEQLKLPGVAVEIQSLQKAMPNTTLMNQDFTVDNFKQQVLAQPFSVVHIASHGVFGDSSDTSFLMAYDNIIDMDELERFLKSDKFAKQPLELLTLSACQTAEGDDRAPLGLSGIAIKAKVRSALGSLWPVADEAASQLMAEFYKGLSQPGVSKAQAMRQAQISLLKQKKLENPFYWSPFILVGNWL